VLIFQCYPGSIVITIKENPFWYFSETEVTTWKYNHTPKEVVSFRGCSIVSYHCCVILLQLILDLNCRSAGKEVLAIVDPLKVINGNEVGVVLINLGREEGHSFWTIVTSVSIIPVKRNSRTLSVFIVHFADCVVILLDCHHIKIEVLWIVLLPCVDDPCLLWAKSRRHDHILVNPLIGHGRLHSQILGGVLISVSPKVNLINTISWQWSKGYTGLAAELDSVVKPSWEGISMWDSEDMT